MTLSRLIAVLAGLLLAASNEAFAQNYPSQPVRLVVTFPPGGIDMVARLLAEQMSASLGQPVIVETRPGANGMIGTEYVSRQPADGHTLVFTTTSTLISGVLMMKHATVDPVKDFTPISLVYAASQLFAVHKKVPVKTFKEFVDYARSNPNKLFYATSGIGSAFQLTMEALKEVVSGLEIVDVPYKGTGPAAQALISGEVTVGLPNINSAAPYIQNGTLIPLAVLREKRLPTRKGRPDVLSTLPTVKEVMPNFQRPASWIGMLAPAGVPAPIIKRLNEVVVKASHSAKVVEYLDNGGNELIANSSEDAAARIKEDLASTAKIIKALGIQPQ